MAKHKHFSLVLLLLMAVEPMVAYAGFFSIFGTTITVTTSKEKYSERIERNVNSQNMVLLEPAANPDPKIAKTDIGGPLVEDGALVADVGPLGSAADIELSSKGEQIGVYVVRPGDSLGEIAEMFDVSVNTLVWANDITGGKISVGQTLVILPVTGVTYTVKRGDTLKSIASKFRGNLTDIANFNGIPVSGDLAEGDEIIIPDGEVPVPVVVSTPPTSSKKQPFRYRPPHDTNGPAYDGYYIRPVVRAIVTQGLHGYNGVDLGAAVGEPILASAAGTVLIGRNQGYNGGYGKYVVISHPNGTQTVYGHASKVIVQPGQAVDRGQIIAYVGSTGNSTGPHLHFEIRGARNPFDH